MYTVETEASAHFTCNESDAEAGQEEDLEDEVASFVHNQPRHYGDDSQTEVLHCLHSVYSMHGIIQDY